MAAIKVHGDDSDSDSDFGYDFTSEDENVLLQLTVDPAPSPQPLLENTVTRTIDAVPGRTEILTSRYPVDFPHHNGQPACDGVGSAVHGLPPEVESRCISSPISFSDEISYPNPTEGSHKDPAPGLNEMAGDTSEPAGETDGRPPIQRFRSFPRKPLTVTDLTSGAWCELQYWYTLTRLPGGRRTRNAAMKQGTKVHKKLEDEVHTTVHVEVTTREDRFGLKLWNLIQGLRTLRDTGMTRELEVWGTVDGNLVNGVIDELSYQNPNPQFEAELSSQELRQDNLSQSILTDYFPSKSQARTRKQVYLADVKTRGTLTPVSHALLRPAKIQLLLYHRFLSGMASGQLDFYKVLRRYGLNADAPFSDAFLAQIAGLHDEMFVDVPQNQQEHPTLTDDGASGLDELEGTRRDALNYQSLRELINLVKSELALTFPDGEDSVGNMLNIKYIYRGDGREIDTHDFPYSNDAMNDYLSHYMSWWRGERRADGVQIEEAFKCRTCEFVDDCSWRQRMDYERVQNARRKASSKTSMV